MRFATIINIMKRNFKCWIKDNWKTRIRNSKTQQPIKICWGNYVHLNFVVKIKTLLTRNIHTYTHRKRITIRNIHKKYICTDEIWKSYSVKLLKYLWFVLNYLLQSSHNCGKNLCNIIYKSKIYTFWIINLLLNWKKKRMCVHHMSITKIYTYIKIP